jgi:hypothetical protein
MQAAKFIGDLAAEGLTNAGEEGLKTALDQNWAATVNVIWENKFPQLLQNSGLSDAAIVALTLAIIEAIASSEIEFEFNLVHARAIPFFSTIFAPHTLSRAVTAIELPQDRYDV